MAQGNLDEAKRHYTGYKAIAQRLAASDPDNADWQRDLWVSYWKLADLSEKNGQAAEARETWRKAYRVIAGMKERGLHLSPQDEGFLQRLRQKAGE